jgi:hypothetical protein
VGGGSNEAEIMKVVVVMDFGQWQR